MSHDRVVVELSSDEALVLFEFLSRYSDSAELKIQDQSEQRVLWDLCCFLEKKLSVQFSDGYVHELGAARARTRDRVESRNL
jgi:hypothetical protein